MYGVVSLLDEEYEQRVASLWQELHARFGIGSVLESAPVPHFSYHVAQAYDLEWLTKVLAEQAEKTVPFTVRTAGIGFFTGAKMVLYIPVARTPALCRLHEQVYPVIDIHGHGANSYYSPNRWFPHITLSEGDITDKNIGPVTRWLTQQDSAWQIRINNLAVMGAEEWPYVLQQRFDFKEAT